MHTSRSFDGKNTAREMVDSAYALGIPVVALTDHCEINEYYSHGYCSMVPRAYEDACAQRDRAGAPEVLAGIELGQPGANYELAQRVLDARPYDFVLASVHNLLNMRDFYYLSYTEENAGLLLDRYFDELLRLAQWGNFDSLAHLTYPLRYITGEFGIPVDLSKYDEKIDALLRLLALKEKALEVNTSGYRQKIGMALPHLELVARFRRMGGRYVTLGADAHCTEDVGRGIAEGVGLIREAGFRFVTVYRGRVPFELPIDAV